MERRTSLDGGHVTSFFGFHVPDCGDFHLHTRLSDGLLSPERLVAEARTRGLTHIAVTDHDTMAGVAAARAEGRRRGVVVLPGVEISTRYRGREVHLLGYGLDPADRAVAERFDRFRAARWTRIERMIGKLTDLGLGVTVADVKRELLDEATLPCRPHLARALQRSGAVATVAESFVRFIGNNGPAYVGIEDGFEATEAIRFVRDHAGLCVVAHPYASDVAGLLPDLVAAGIDGVECHHPDHDPDRVRDLLRFCHDTGLLVTGGSDAHGETEVGQVRMAADEITAALARIEERGGLI